MGFVATVLDRDYYEITGAFVLVELTGIPHTQINIAAALPAILYFAIVWIGVNG